MIKQLSLKAVLTLVLMIAEGVPPLYAIDSNNRYCA
jgi:hypothetical protein